MELERSAGRAQARGGLAAAAAFLQRAVALTQDPARRADRALAAAQASLQAGAFDAALGLLATAEAGPLDEFQRARVDLLRAQRRLRLGSRQRRSAAAAEGREAARAVRPGARARDLPDRLGRGAVLAEDVAARASCYEICRAVASPPAAAGRSASARPAARRPRPADHRRTRRRDPDVAASSESVRRSIPRGGRPALGLDGRRPPAPPCGTTRAASRSPRGRSSSSATPARWRRCRFTSPHLGMAIALDGRLRGCRLARRGDRQRGGGDREPRRALRLAAAPGAAGEGSRGHPQR